MVPEYPPFLARAAVSCALLTLGMTMEVVGDANDVAQATGACDFVFCALDLDNQKIRDLVEAYAADALDAMKQDAGFPINELRVDGGAAANDLLNRTAGAAGVPEPSSVAIWALSTLEWLALPFSASGKCQCNQTSDAVRDDENA